MSAQPDSSYWFVTAMLSGDSPSSSRTPAVKHTSVYCKVATHIAIRLWGTMAWQWFPSNQSFPRQPNIQSQGSGVSPNG